MAISRRTCLLALTFMVAVLLALPGGIGLLTENARVDAQDAERPNFVFVMADDLDERSMQDLPGIREIMTNNIMSPNGTSTNGTTFENAYVTYSLCCPSRASILRGQYPHNHEIIGNGLPEGGEEKFRNLGGNLGDNSTVATWLNNAGYQTKFIGVYMPNYLFKDGLYVPPGWDEWFALKDGHYNLADPRQAEVNADGQRTTLGGHSSDVFADKASDFIRRSHENPAPFFAMVGTRAPHSPPEVAVRYQDRFATTPLPNPPNFDEEDISDKPQWLQSYGRLSETRKSTMQNTYRQRLRSMLSVEDMLRQIITTLNETGELHNTYIFFTSDNGYHMGHHRLDMNKKTPYEEDIGVPLMVRGPGIPANQVRKQLVLNNDFAPTIADLAGVSTPAFVDGSSFAPLLTGSPPSSWRTAFLEEGWLEGGTIVPTPTHKSVHTQRYMFTEYDTGEHELYDLSTDPYQLESQPNTTANAPLYDELQARLNVLRNCSADMQPTCHDAEWGTITTPTDTTDPQITITTPPQGATYTLGQSVAASYECTDADSGVASCEGTVADGANIDTSSTGTKTFSVNATDNAGNTNTVSHTYTVNAQTTSCTKSGTSASETITGTSGADVICGLGGNDILKGLGGNDTLRGEDGNDTLQGGVGNETLEGGTGTDTASYSASLTAVTASLATNSSTGEGSDTFLSVENLLGSSKADTLTGSAANNKLTGGSGPDTQSGGSGNDQVIGSGGADTLKGEDGDDTVNSKDGVNGNDSLDGGAGTDTKVTDATEKSIVNFP